MKKLFTYIGIIAVLAIILPILSGCSDDKEQPDTPDWCGTTGNLHNISGVKGTVISTSDGYYILPLEPVKGFIRTDTLCLILAFKNISDGVRLDLSEYIGQTIMFDCSMSALPPSFEQITIDEQKVSAGVYYVQNLIIKDNKSCSGTKIEILNSNGTTVYSATAENSAVVTIPKERLSAGDYTAIIYSGSSKEEIPFAI